jgi:hypothetical protein
VIFAARRAMSVLEFLQEGRWGWVVLAVTLIVLFSIVLKLKAWVRVKGLAENSAEQLLLEFRDIHRQGKLSPDEYRLIRERLTKKTGQSDSGDNAAQGPFAGDSAGTSSAGKD